MLPKMIGNTYIGYAYIGITIIRFSEEASNGCLFILASYLPISYHRTIQNTDSSYGYRDTEHTIVGFPGCVCSVDCVHVRIWGVSANLKQVIC